MASFLLFGAFALVTAILYFLNTLNKKFEYWRQRGVPQLNPQLIYGDSKDFIQQKKFQGEQFREFYFKFKKMGVSHGGVYTFTNRTWVPVNPNLIKTILTKDFLHFSAHNRKIPGLYFNNLFHMDGEEWKDMRRKLTPSFTSGKMKMMFNIILEKANGLDKLVGNICKKGEPVEIKDVLVRFTTDIISSCAFGIESNTMVDVNSEFYKHVQDGFQEKTRKKEGFLLFKHILAFLGFAKQQLPNFKRIEDFFREVIRDTLKYREDNKVIRKDFVHLMIQLKNKGAVTELTSENEDIYQKTIKNEVMSLEDIAGQCLLFFSAGFGTSSSTMSFAMLELAQHQDVQEKLRQEVREALQKYNGKLTYESLQDMKYCENVIYETLRKYPSLPVLLRLCTKSYTVPGTNSVIEKGTNVNIPVWGLQMDPEYFPDPEKFIPERFDDENKNKIRDFTFLPFGEGPRMCLGLRFGVMQSKAGLATLINGYKFTINKKTAYPADLKKTSFVPEVNGGIFLDAVKLA